MGGEIPQWAVERAFNLANKAGANWTTFGKMLEGRTGEAFARYIAEHEEPPVDPLLIEARKIVEFTVHWSPQTDRDLQSGKNDQTSEVKIALAALKRGIEIGKSNA
ncbi:MAG: hypothetical protein KGL39_60135 [Patescibacteria group bacterium]|nr:hypothetical protein [Patescibacteria group bacterium]